MKKLIIVLLVCMMSCMGFTHSYALTLPSAFHYHIFARKANLNVHTNGNVATELLDGKAMFGTSQLFASGQEEISYVKDYINFASSSYASTLYVGSAIDVVEMDNGHAVGLQKETPIKLDHIKDVKVDDHYINFDEEFAHLDSLSSTLFQYSETSYQLDTTDINHVKLKVTPGIINIIHLKMTDLAHYPQLHLQDIDTNNTTVIINIDMKDYSGDIPTKTFFTDTNGITHYNGERGEFHTSRLLWNFYDSSTNKPYTGLLNFNREWMGTILASQANIIARSNIDGSIICQEFTNHGETHRYDFSGDLPQGPIEEPEIPQEPALPDTPEEPVLPDTPEIPEVPTPVEPQKPMIPQTPTEPEVFQEPILPENKVPVVLEDNKIENNQKQPVQKEMVVTGDNQSISLWIVLGISSLLFVFVVKKYSHR